jgi:hypothetical protein
MGKMIDRINIYAVFRETCKNIIEIDTVKSIIKNKKIR